MLGKGILSLVAIFSMTCVVAASSSPFTTNELDIIKRYFFNNIATKQRTFTKMDHGQLIKSQPGAVLASPSNKGPGFSQDYQFHWVRDAALSMNEVVYLYTQATADEKKRLRSYLDDYVRFEHKAQLQTSKNGEQTLGQPKYNIDGTIWEGEWMRPQNDGPALRATTLIAIANVYSRENKQVDKQLITMITTDLNYVAAKWRNTSFDVWEEVKDPQHFFTQMVQRKALYEGAMLFKHLGNNKKANTYFHIAQQMTQSLQQNWNAGRGYISETVNQQYIKGGGINSAVILGALYGNIGKSDDPFALNSDTMLSSVYFIRNAFAGLYKINIDHTDHPPLLGRYPNDIYDGDKFVYGNPWILTTNALAQYYYELAKLYVKQGHIAINKNNKLFFQQIDPSLGHQEEVVSSFDDPENFATMIALLTKEGDKCLELVKQYASCYPDSSCYHFAEQVDRSTGKQTSAKDLTWGYASLLAAMQVRQEIS
jgi:glucoamylase